MKRDLTIGECAGLAGVAVRTATRWTDSQALPSYRLPTGHKPRRVRAVDLAEFLGRHGVPLPQQLARLGVHRTLIVGMGPGGAGALASRLATNAVTHCSTVFHAGAEYAERRHTAVIVDGQLGRAEVRGLVRTVRDLPAKGVRPTVVLLAGGDADVQGHLGDGYDAVFQAPHDVDAIVQFLTPKEE